MGLMHFIQLRLQRLVFFLQLIDLRHEFFLQLLTFLIHASAVVRELVFHRFNLLILLRYQLLAFTFEDLQFLIQLFVLQLQIDDFGFLFLIRRFQHTIRFDELRVVVAFVGISFFFFKPFFHLVQSFLQRFDRLILFLNSTFIVLISVLIEFVGPLLQLLRDFIHFDFVFFLSRLVLNFHVGFQFAHLVFGVMQLFLQQVDFIQLSLQCLFQSDDPLVFVRDGLFVTHDFQLQLIRLFHHGLDRRFVLTFGLLQCLVQVFDLLSQLLFGGRWHCWRCRCGNSGCTGIIIITSD
mmetsp:Transcript_11533/g.33153  ORF Transcript_11533/g.33153 Transcript_11533/m.33153 type:complete len:293 (-) Transcript_11533:1558-2436(-)